MTEAVKTHYQVLGIESTAGFLEIKNAYRRLAKRYHPDRLVNPSEEDQKYFSEIAEAYRVLSHLGRRQAYDFTLNQSAGAAPPPPPPRWGFYQPHYSGYPYFQWDFLTPYIHAFFIGDLSGRPVEDKSQALLFNYKTLIISVLGALFFFKFFTAVNGVIVKKDIEERLFNNVSYMLTLETEEKKKVRKRVKMELYDQIKAQDTLEKSFFSMSYRINGQEIPGPGIERFFLQVFMIYVVITGGLFLLERGRARPLGNPQGRPQPD